MPRSKTCKKRDPIAAENIKQAVEAVTKPGPSRISFREACSIYNIKTATLHRHVKAFCASEAEAISDYELEVNSASTKGDGYLGTISSVHLIDESKKLNLILKEAARSEELSSQVAIRSAYLREIYIYNTIFPEFENFQRKHYLQDKFDAFAKIYGSSDEVGNEYLILENLKENGYKMWNRQFSMDPEHVELVFLEYGKFHAVSLAMRDKDPEKFYELTKNMNDIYKDSVTREEWEYSIKVMLDNGFTAIKGNTSATEALQRFSDVAVNYLLEDIHVSEDNIVIIHGDSWCNNMMFKYEDNQNPHRPTKICLIDWQLAKIGSPLLDLAYFLFVCSSKDILNDYRKYLKIYHDVVCKNLTKLSCDPEKIFPFSLLEKHWKKYAKFGLYMAIMVIKLMLSEVDEIPDLDNIDCLNFESVHSKDYNQRILDIVNFLEINTLI